MSSENHLKSKVGAAFGTVVVLMIAIVLINTSYLNEAAKHLDRVVGIHNVQKSMMHQILDLARQRSLTLQTMLLEDDLFLIDDQILKMSEINSEYLRLRDSLLALPFTNNEIELLEKQNVQTISTGKMQGRVMRMLTDGDYSSAKQLFYEKVIPSQVRAMELMHQYVTLQDEQNQQAMISTRNDVASERNHSLFLLAVGLLLSLFIASWVLARIRREINRRNGIEAELETRVQERTREVEELSALATEAHMQTLFDAAPEFIFVIDAEGVILQTNQYALIHSGFAVDEIVGREIKEFFTEDSKKLCDCNFPGLREHGSNRADIEFICKDGRVINMECAATAVPDKNGEFTSFMIIQRDVTENRRAANALANSERRFRTLFNSTFQYICVLNPDGFVLEVNRTLLEFLDDEPENIIGRLFCHTLAMGSVMNDMQPMYKAIVRAILGDLVHIELELKRKDGADVTVDFSLKPVMNEKNEPVLIIAEGRDITERRKTEEEAKQHLRESAHFLRLNTMGEMASGMAHELNQPLTAIGSYCESASSMISDLQTAPAELKDILERATEQAQRAGGIIKQLRSFVGKDETNKEPLDIDDLMFKIFKFVNWEIQNSGIIIDTITGSHGHTVLANKIQIEQVVLNLVMNSMEAIQEEGINNAKLILQTRVKTHDSIELTVTDNGPGIDPAIVDMAFDPFQSSKKTGMGLGLSISRSIIEAHGGRLWIDQQYQGGARFGFELPIYESGHELKG